MADRTSPPRTPLGILVNVCGTMETSLIVVRRVLREFFGGLSLLRQDIVIASVNTIGCRAPLHRPVCALDPLVKQIEQIRPTSTNGSHGQNCSCLRDFHNAMRLLRQTETQVVYITTPTTLPTKAEIENAQLQGKSTGRIQVILLRSEDEDIQATSSSVMAFVDATSRMESVSIEQAEDSLFDLRRVIVSCDLI
ncbi:hypothetical protein LEN26_010639 [Aphanomyces euteiches]|nr:hypothetical protein Ae201684P_019618 [Aphanomyces euteiches]KAH9109575.1 hypothetical protein AeMF1_015377 [Aphanomyces euteiches]KAH9121489.1 hypothetical protein LEN26_010639 [Aphanomyces euteiches]KAH9140847.1 hypothetical protein AeRB84_014925 [Aphanomyces euteiches]KAH9192897.1 hypothetical protein AeNC1_005134 [Aphanomyces euteiches]